LGNISGGLSGPALYSVNLLNVYKLRNFELPVIASGGVDSYISFKGYLKAGACCAGIGTALFKDPELPTKIFYALQEDLDAMGVSSFNEFVRQLRSGPDD
jgi:dihydroorotate dehydrogenase